MKLLNNLKNVKMELKLAIVFAVSMLLTSILVSGHEHTNALVILQVGLYFVVTGLTKPHKQCHTNTVQ